MERRGLEHLEAQCRWDAARRQSPGFACPPRVRIPARNHHSPGAHNRRRIMGQLERRAIIAIYCFLFACQAASAAQPTIDWVAAYNGPGSYWDSVNDAMAVSYTHLRAHET